ncbi:MAG: OmpA family protein [Sphingobium sp.]|nr:OmpA family protein [Sphingobium sp.]
MSIITFRSLAALIVSTSPFALNAALAATSVPSGAEQQEGTQQADYCSHQPNAHNEGGQGEGTHDAALRRCGPYSDDSSVGRRGIARNLERGGSTSPATDSSADNGFRVSIDGAGDNSPANHQRSADVALAKDDIIVQITRLDAQPMLSVIPSRPAVRPGQMLGFETMTNYAAFIDRAELRLFREGDATEGTPFTTIKVTPGEKALWTVPDDEGERGYRAVLRVYDAKGRFDETAPVPVMVTVSPRDQIDDSRNGPSFDNMRVIGNIPVAGTEVTVSGGVEDAATVVSAFGVAVPVDKGRRFVTQQIVPKGVDDVVIHMRPPTGGVKEYRRALNAPKDDHFLVGIADITAGHRSFDTNRRAMQGDDLSDTRTDFIDGRFAFYYRGRLSETWKLTASADTGEQRFSDLFDGFLKRDPRSLLRRLDADRHYPVYGDDSTTMEDAPTYGRFYVRAESANSEAMWGNFHTQLTGNELIRYQRGLYGAQVKWRNEDSTSFGERRTEVNGFAADPGTIGSREDFASTGGSVYYLRNQDIAEGSERLFVEVRDRDSGLVLERRELIAARDYEMNYIQGRIVLRDALPMVADTSLFVHNASLAGNPVWLVSSYEYVPGLTRPDSMTLGGRAQHWLNDMIRVGVTGYHQGEDQASQDLYGADLMLRFHAGTYLRGEFARSDGAGNGASFSSTGGYDFTQLSTVDRKSDAFNVEGAMDFAEVFGKGSGRLSSYWRRRDQGFSGPGELNFNEGLDQYGGMADVEIASGLRMQGKADITDGTLTQRHALEAGLRYQPVKGWFGTVGVRSDKQQGQASAYSPITSAPDMTGTRTDLAASIGYRHVPAAPTLEQDSNQEDHTSRPWSVAAFGQTTLDRSGGRLANDRLGVNGEVQFTDRLGVKAEVSDGDLGVGADARATYTMGDRGSLYLGYALAAENPDSFNTGRLGRMTLGGRRRVGTSTSVFAEGRYEHGSGPTGLTQAYGVDFNPIPGWTFGLRYERGSLSDALGSNIRREVIGSTADYGDDRLRWSTAMEFRRDGSATLGTRETWATRNQVTFKASDALRLFGKANLSISDGGNPTTSLDADYYELVAAAAYRPTQNDRLNVLAKYTYLYDLPSPAQVDSLGLNLDYAQRSHIWAIDSTYQLTPRLAVGGKVAHRIGSLRASRDGSAPWFDSKATFWAARADYRVIARWDMLLEVRQLSVSEAQDSRLGALAGIYRHMGNHLKLGVGYNFTDYSDDLSDLSYDDRGFFLNLIGKF